MKTEIQQLIVRYRTPQVIHEQTRQRGFNAVLHDLQAAQHSLSTPNAELDALERLFRLTWHHLVNIPDSAQEAYIIQQLRDCAFHEGDDKFVAGCDIWLAGKAHLRTASNLRYPAPPALLRTVPLDLKPVNAFAYSPDGISVAIAHDDDNLQVWDTIEWALRLTLVGHDSAVQDCTYSPDGEHIASAAWDGTIRVWDAHTSTLRFTMQSGSIMAETCAYSPDGSLIISGHWDGTLTIWNANTGQEIFTWDHHGQEIKSCFYLPDGNSIVSAARDVPIKIWDAHTYKRKFSLKGQDYSEIYACSPDGNYILTNNPYKGILTFWNAHTGKLSHKISIGKLTDLSFSPDGAHVACVVDNKLSVCDAKTFKEQTVLYENYPDRIFPDIKQCKYSPDGRFILSASKNYAFQLWDAACTTSIKQPSSTWRYGKFTCALSPDGRRLAYADKQNGVTIQDLVTSEIIFNLSDEILSSSNGTCAYSVDGRYLATDWYKANERTFILKILDLTTNTITLTLDGQFHCAAFSPNNRFLVTEDTGRYTIWDLQSGQNLRSMKSSINDGGFQSHGINACVYSPDGTMIVGASEDGTMTAWDATTGAELFDFGNFGPVADCAFSPDGEFIISCTKIDPAITIWEARTGTQLAVLRGHLSDINGCAYLANGRYIVSVSDDKTIRIWDATSHQCLAVFTTDVRLEWVKVGSHDHGPILCGPSDRLYYFEWHPDR